MVKPKRDRDLDQTFSPRTSSPPSMRDALPAESVTDPLKHLTIQIPESLRTEVKRAALDQGISVRDLVTEALQNHLKRHSKK